MKSSFCIVLALVATATATAAAINTPPSVDYVPWLHAGVAGSQEAQQSAGWVEQGRAASDETVRAVFALTPGCTQGELEVKTSHHTTTTAT